jgi:hypothetical protein
MPAAWITMDRYFENMVKVSYDVMEPKEAAEEVESWVVGDVSASSGGMYDTLQFLDDSGTTTAHRSLRLRKVDSSPISSVKT